MDTERFVPVTMGSPRFRSVATEGLRVSDAAFAPGDMLSMHRHESTILAVMLDGGFSVAFRSRTYDCPVGMVFVEPGGDPHANRVGCEGARVLVLEIPADTLDALGRSCRHLASSTSAWTQPSTVALARRLRAELSSPDAVSPLSIEALAIDLIAEASDRKAAPARFSRHPGWLARVQEMLDDHLESPLRVSDLSREVGVHRVHLGRAFRQRYGVSLGEYHRRARVRWAAAKLAGGDELAADIAAQAGFADASHFTRVFRRVVGVAPNAYRMRHRARTGDDASSAPSPLKDGESARGEGSSGPRCS